jgi:hypothetical protein
VGSGGLELERGARSSPQPVGGDKESGSRIPANSALAVGGYSYGADIDIDWARQKLTGIPSLPDAPPPRLNRLQRGAGRAAGRKVTCGNSHVRRTPRFTQRAQQPGDDLHQSLNVTYQVGAVWVSRSLWVVAPVSRGVVSSGGVVSGGLVSSGGVVSCSPAARS